MAPRQQPPRLNDIAKREFTGLQMPTPEDNNRADLVTLAAYLPQFHTIPENDEWWGEGFTEWKHLRRARAWFRGHRTRRPSRDIGEYTLPDGDVMIKQSRLATEAGITGFAVWDYWFGDGVRLLEKPMRFVSEEGIPFRYALFWANHSWFNKSKNALLMEQKYLGAEDYEKYFDECIIHFRSPNYIKIDGKLVFGIFDPGSIPDLAVFINTWNARAADEGLGEFFWIGDRLELGDSRAALFHKIGDGFRFWTLRKKLLLNFIIEKCRTKLRISLGPQVYDYSKVTKGAFKGVQDPEKFLPTVLAGWDTTPRHQGRGVAFTNYTPESFSIHLNELAEFFHLNPIRQPVVFLKSWNEWAEGNAIEPDSTFGTAFLEAYRRFVDRVNSDRKAATIEVH
jgi:hypothetical protein